MVIHSLKVIRDDKVINKLNSSDFQTLRKEAEAENYIYDGSITAFTNLSDVRTNDIVEYSYTIKGFNPIHKKKYATTFNIETSEPIGKMFLKFVSSTPLDIKYFHTDLRFNSIRKGGNNIYRLSQENIPPHEFEEATPIWYISSGLVNISNYRTWKNVVDWGVDLYKVNDELSLELNKKISDLNHKYKSQGGKIKATLNFVQNKIRYLGLENGIGAYKPFSPNKVFNQRYGDCKDKSLLLVTMLNKMGIEAYPVLVNTYLKKTVNELLPSASNFNHCVVKVIDKKKNIRWYDPTITNQGGKSSSTSFPDYRYGLVLKKGNSSLEEIYPFNHSDIETIDIITLDQNGKGAYLKVITKYYGSEADYIRVIFKNNSTTSLQKKYKSYYSSKYKLIKSNKPLKHVDNLRSNIFTIYEEYRIDDIWSPSSIRKGELVAEFTPYSISNLLSMPENLERETPYNLVYPATRRHKILIKVTDENWNLEQENFYINSDHFFYDKNSFFNKKSKLLTIEHTYTSQNDHVPIKEFSDFYTNLTKLKKKITYSLIKNENPTALTSSLNGIKIIGIMIYIVLAFLFIWLAVKIYSYDITPTIHSYYEPNKKIGGWLIIIGLSLVTTLIFKIIELFLDNHFNTGNWLVFISQKEVNLTFSVLLTCGLIFNVLYLVYYPLAIILFFKRRSTFPRVHSLFLGISFTFYITYMFTYKHLTKSTEDYNVQISSVLLLFIIAGIMIPYLLTSDRSKETFVKTLKK